MAEVRIQEGESLENALCRFKRKVQQEDIIKEVKRHSFYLRPGEKNVSRKPWHGNEAARKLAKSTTDIPMGRRPPGGWPIAFSPNRFAFGSAGLLPRSSSGVSVQML